MTRKWTGFAAALVVVAGTLLVVSSVGAKPLGPDKREGLNKQVSAKLEKARALVRLLDEEIDMKDFQVPMKFKEGLGLIYEKLASTGKELPILINMEAFKVADPDSPDIYEVDVKFPPFPKRMAVSTVLHVMLSQIPGQNSRATYIIRRGHVEITTRQAASPSRLLEEPVAAVFDNLPLEVVLHDLSAMSGATVIVDSRIADNVKMPVSATFLNDTSLEGALTLLSDMVGATFVVIEDTLYVTSPDNARILRKGRTGKKSHGNPPTAGGGGLG